MELNLIAKNKSEELVKAYLEENASEILAEKINNGVLIVKDGNTVLNVKTLAGFMEYAKGEARKLAAKGASYACVEDSTVFGWAIHYFEEDKITEKLYNEDGSEYKPSKKEEQKIKDEKAKQFAIDLAQGLAESINERNEQKKAEEQKRKEQATERVNAEVQQAINGAVQPKKKVPKGVSEGQISFFDFGE